MTTTRPRYPVFIPSRARPTTCLTARCLDRDDVPFVVVVAPRELAAYVDQFGPDRVTPLPSDSMDIVSVRNWIKDQSVARGDVRHWQLDDNISWWLRRWRGRRLHCDTGTALAVVEDFADRYTNVAIAGHGYDSFAHETRSCPPFVVNCHVYSSSLILNAAPYRWRGPYNDDTDLCLQVLAGGWCTVLFNAFLAAKAATMTMKGGMTDANANSYQGDGRLKMARALERRWPGVVETKRRFKRPQHVIKGAWQKFDTPLIYRPDFDPAALPPTNDYGLRLTEVGPITSPILRDLVAADAARHQPGGTP